jgi:hypothetical protein
MSAYRESLPDLYALASTEGLCSWPRASTNEAEMVEYRDRWNGFHTKGTPGYKHGPFRVVRYVSEGGS